MRAGCSILRTDTIRSKLAFFVAILAIGAWIGWTMATTPPPKPIEEITTEIEEKKEEPKPEEVAPETSAEEKKPEKKRKS